MSLHLELSPNVVHKGRDICEPEKHAMYSVMLECPFALEKSAAALRQHCHEECEETLAWLRNMNACELLQDLCHSFRYTEVGPGECKTRAVEAEASASSESEEEEAHGAEDEDPHHHTEELHAEAPAHEHAEAAGEHHEEAAREEEASS